MGQVTIYIEDSALDAAKRAAARAKVSVSQWFAKQAIDERQRQSQSWETFFAELDILRGSNPDDGLDGWDDLLADRHAGLGKDTPRASF